MKAPVRRVDARVTIDYTDPTQDQTIEVTASEQANASYPAQTADFATEPTHKWAALDGVWVLDGTWHLAPVPEDAYLYQMGWWSAQVAGEDGRFSEPYPTLILTHPARPVITFQVVGDSARGEWPIEFAIRLYGPDGTLLRERVVTGNAEIQFYELLVPPALDVTRQELEIRAWSRPGAHAKILEFFTSLQETYEGSDLLEIHLLEESESGSGVGIGGVTTNELAVRLVNRGGRWDVTNPDSPLRELLRPNRRVRAWLGVEGAKHLWGEGWYAPFDRDLTLSRQNGVVIEPLPDYVVTRRPDEGRFGGAVAVEEGTTNRVPGNIQAWSDYSFQASTYSIAPVSTPYGSGVRLTGQAAGRVGKTTSGNINLGTSYATASIYFKPNVASGILKIYWDAQDNAGGWRYGTFAGEAINLSAYAPGTWYRLVCTASIAPNTFAGGSGFYVWAEGTFDVEIAAPQLEAKPFATSFVDGTRAGGVLTYPSSVVPANQGTVSLWVLFPQQFDGAIGGWRRIFTNGNQSTVPGFLSLNGFSYNLSEANILRFMMCDDAGNEYSIDTDKPPAGWHHVAITWNANEMALYVDGEKKASRTDHTVPSAHPFDWIAIGARADNYDHINTLLDELLILPYAASEEIIAELYRETRPLYDEWVPLGTYWSGDWDSQDLEAMVRGRDRLELMRRTPWEPGPLRQNVSLYALAEDVMRSAELPPEWYWIDPALQDIVVPWGWVPPGSHRDALRVIAEAGMARVYCDRDGILRIEQVTTPSGGPILEITADDYFPPARHPVSGGLVANRVVVTTQPLVLAASTEEIYRATVDVPPGATITVRAEYRKRPVIDAAASLESPPAGVSIVEANYGATGAEVQIRNTGASMASVTLAITGRPLSVEGGEQVVEEDDLSIRELGLIVHEVPSNPLVQTSEHARAISLAILTRSAQQRRDVELEWRGNPALEVDDVVSVDGMQAQVVRQELSWAGALSARITARRLS